MALSNNSSSNTTTIRISQGRRLIPDPRTTITTMEVDREEHQGSLLKILIVLFEVFEV